jgi:hypothetical protein
MYHLSMKKISLKRILLIILASLFIFAIAQYFINEYGYRLMGNMECNEETGVCIDRGIK